MPGKTHTISELAKEFGASDSHRYIDAILDAVASGRN